MPIDTEFAPGGAQGPDHELRAIESPIRATADEIEGYAAVFDQVAEIMPGFREVVRAGAFTRTLAEGADVRAFWNHNPDMVLGRTGSGTLALTEDDHGLRYVIRPPDTQWARDAMVSIARGDVNQSSFMFAAVVDRWTHDEAAGYSLRELIDVELFDVSPVAFPAYAGTTVGVRAADDLRRAISRHISGQVRGVGPEFVQAIVDEMMVQPGGAGQEADPPDALDELRLAQARHLVRRRKLRLQELKLRK